MSNPNKENPNQAADPAELNVEDLELLNKGVLEDVTGGGIYGPINTGGGIRAR